MIRFAPLAVGMAVCFVFGWWARGCGAKDETPAERMARRDAEALPAGFIVSDIPGVDFSGLDDRQRLVALDLMNRIPCLAAAGGMSVARCRRDVPQCVTSQRMADFIIDKVRRGMDRDAIFVAVYDKALDEDSVRPKISGKATNLDVDNLAKTGSGPVTVVVMYDYTSQISLKAIQSAEELLKLYGDKVKLVYWPFPMENLRPGSERAARIALAADNLGGFEKIHKLLAGAEGKASDAEIAAWAEQQQLPSLADEINSERVVQRLKTLTARAGNAGVEFPPVFFVQGRKITGPVPGACFLADAVQTAIAESVRAEYHGIEERIAP